ncbi:hypothetical protein HY571_02110 [Candidatus Micrarchaeota archaeon]|nr:hypothetical protein [Candidatus Micrarchaeota archaeon]
MTEDSNQLTVKMDSLLEAVEQLQKSQEKTTEALSMLAEELSKLQKILEQTVK